jgi:hypothetical protein
MQAVCDLALNFAEDGEQKKMSRPFGAFEILNATLIFENT